MMTLPPTFGRLALLLLILCLPTVAHADPVSPLLEADAVSVPTPDLHAVTLAALEAPAPAMSPTIQGVPTSPVRSAVENLLVTVVLPGIGGLLMIAFGAASLALKRYLEERGKTSATARVASRVVHLAEAVVQDLEATLKAEYERAAADGTITKEEGAHLRDVALQRLKSSLGDHGLAELRDVLGVGAGPSLANQLIAVDQYLGGVVEGAVAKVSAMARVGVPFVTTAGTATATATAVP